MPDQLQLRGGTTAQHTSFTGASKEVTVDTTKKTAVVHDGSTVGGVPLLREDGSNSALTLGSAGTPSIKFTGDTNTGIYSPGADQVAISTNGAGRLFVDASGNVGISMSSPISNAGYGGLSINGTDGAILSMMQGGSETFRVTNATGYSFINTTGATPLLFGTAANERLRITSAGLVGIGNSSPAWPLDVNGIAKVKNAVLFEATNSTNRWDLYTNTDNTFRLNYNGAGNDEITITSAGNVGIGTTGPTSKLDVVDTAADPVLSIRAGSTFSPSIYFEASGVNASAIKYDRATQALTFSNNSSSTERARIDNSGRLLVGTSSAPLYGSLQVYKSGDNISSFVADSGFVPIFAWNKTTGSGTFIEFGTGTSYTIRGSITYNSGTGQTSYNLVSDYRAKTLLGNVENSGEIIDALKVYRGLMNGATIERPMLVAHETQEVAPYCVTGEKDAVDDEGNPVYQQMDHQVLVPLLIAEIQQLRARVAALENA